MNIGGSVTRVLSDLIQGLVPPEEAVGGFSVLVILQSQISSAGDQEKMFQEKTESSAYLSRIKLERFAGNLKKSLYILYIYIYTALPPLITAR